MEPSATLHNAPRSDTPIVEQRGPIVFMLFLLIVSGLTATIVGYRVKSADLQRKSELLQTYEKLGGSFEAANTLGSSITSKTLAAEQTTFAVVYEINSRARTYGLYRVLETTPQATLELAIKALFTIGSGESAHTTEDALSAFREPVGPSAEIKNMNPKAARYARQYDRFLARDTEVKLFAYLRDNHDLIVRTAP